MDINSGVGHNIRNQLHPDPDQGGEVGGYLQRVVGQAPNKGKQWQGVSRYKS